MSKEIWYLAHPVSGNPRGNCERAQAWLRWLTEQDPKRIYVAPWMPEVLAFMEVEENQTFSESHPDFFKRILSDDCEVVQKLDGIILVGGRVSRGMQLELDAALAAGKKVCDWTTYETPDQVPEGWLP
jgi:hypothetical protein